MQTTNFIQAKALYCGEPVFILETNTTSYGKTTCMINYNGLIWVDINELYQLVWLPEGI